jgi:hypothetical protein
MCAAPLLKVICAAALADISFALPPSPEAAAGLIGWSQMVDNPHPEFLHRRFN